MCLSCLLYLSLSNTSRALPAIFSPLAGKANSVPMATPPALGAPPPLPPPKEDSKVSNLRGLQIGPSVPTTTGGSIGSVLYVEEEYVGDPPTAEQGLAYQGFRLTAANTTESTDYEINDTPAPAHFPKKQTPGERKSTALRDKGHYLENTFGRPLIDAAEDVGYFVPEQLISKTGDDSVGYLELKEETSIRGLSANGSAGKGQRQYSPSHPSHATARSGMGATGGRDPVSRQHGANGEAMTLQSPSARKPVSFSSGSPRQAQSLRMHQGAQVEGARRSLHAASDVEALSSTSTDDPLSAFPQVHALNAPLHSILPRPVDAPVFLRAAPDFLVSQPLSAAHHRQINAIPAHISSSPPSRCV